jgi:hypothetical protein
MPFSPRAAWALVKDTVSEIGDDDGLPEAHGHFAASEGVTVVSLGLPARRDPTPIRMLDLR